MRKPNYNKTSINSDNDQYSGQSIERYVEQATTTQQPIEGGAPQIFTARKDGVKAEYNIRTDRFAIAQKAMDKASKSYQAKRAEYIKAQTEETTEQTTKESA